MSETIKQTGYHEKAYNQKGVGFLYRLLLVSIIMPDKPSAIPVSQQRHPYGISRSRGTHRHRGR